MGLEPYANSDLVNFNESANEFKVVLIEENKWVEQINILLERKAQDFFDSTNKKYYSRFISKKKRLPTASEYNKFKDELLDNSIPKGIRYSCARINKLIEKYTD